jgi:lipopolysaccharide/colanic/teichoic acid biosynthesis glycosyltransferase
MKRLFDLCVASLILLITAPLMFIIVILIRLDSAGSVMYASPRVGKHGKPFGMLRFRTVDIHKPSHLSMRERMTRVGRFIRNYSLDDVPNVFNILKGDLSVIGPRPTEPERVDLADPIWQEILSVQPGVISPAILQLAIHYNSSPAALKQQLELDYVQHRSFGYDLALFKQGLRGYVISRGNWKARGKPSVEVDYARWQKAAVTPTSEEEHPPSQV